jgi:hypothetical protein
MVISMPPKFDPNAEMEQDFLTPPIWVASNPPPVFERPEMKRTLSDMSSFGGDDEDESIASGSSSEKMDMDDEPQKDNAWIIESLSDISYCDQSD